MCIRDSPRTCGCRLERLAVVRALVGLAGSADMGPVIGASGRALPAGAAALEEDERLAVRGDDLLDPIELRRPAAFRVVAGGRDHVDGVPPGQPVLLVLVAVVRCLLYTSDAADDLTRVDLGGRGVVLKKNRK